MLIHFQNELLEKGLIYKGTHTGWYSVRDECFYTESQVSRVQSSSSSEVSVVATETGSPVEWVEEENYMFRLSAFRETLLAHYEATPGAIHPPHYQKEIMEALKGELADLSISRPKSRLKWGIQVPNDPSHTIYVWFDALTVYLSATGYPWKDEKFLKQLFPPNLQVIGKDILR